MAHPPPGGYPPGGGGQPPPQGGWGGQGYPPYRGAPPAASDMRLARPAKPSNLPVIIGVGCAGLLVVACLLGALVLAFSSNSPSASSDDDDGSRSRSSRTKKKKKKKTKNAPPSGEVWIKSTKPNVKFLKPPGWKQTESGRWGVFKSPDGNAVLAFAGFNRPNESTRLIGRAARVLGVNKVHWRGSPKRGVIGKDRFPARTGAGVCNFRGAGRISYATINPGGSDQLLVVYTVSAAGTDEHRKAVGITLDSLQRR